MLQQRSAGAVFDKVVELVDAATRKSGSSVLLIPPLPTSKTVGPG
jgi:hypothetical protein